MSKAKTSSLVIGLLGGKGRHGSMGAQDETDGEPGEESEEMDTSTGKDSACETMIQAFKDGDAEALKTALEDFIDLHKS